MNSTNVDLGNLMLRLNAQAMEIIRLRQLQENTVDASDPWLVAVINFVHEQRAMGYQSVDVTPSRHFVHPLFNEPRWHVRDGGWKYTCYDTGIVTIEHMMSTIPTLCGMGLGVIVSEPINPECPFKIIIDTKWMFDDVLLEQDRCRNGPLDNYHFPTAPCTMFTHPMESYDDE
jgi:hypothetical protein